MSACTSVRSGRQRPLHSEHAATQTNSPRFMHSTFMFVVNAKTFNNKSVLFVMRQKRRKSERNIYLSIRFNLMQADKFIHDSATTTHRNVTAAPRYQCFISETANTKFPSHLCVCASSLNFAAVPLFLSGAEYSVESDVLSEVDAQSLPFFLCCECEWFSILREEDFSLYSRNFHNFQFNNSSDFPEFSEFCLDKFHRRTK